MTTKLFMADLEDEKRWETPGAVFPFTLTGGLDGPHAKAILSEFYFRDHAGKRDPLIVILPDGNAWMIDRNASNGPGWEVSGDPPSLTARPSIATETYHGWLNDGVLSDDLEGRTYD